MAETKRDTGADLDTVYAFLKDADKYGLTSEVVLFALYYMKEHPECSIGEAMDYGHCEWVK